LTAALDQVKPNASEGDRRSRDAPASRRALLLAAQDLFGQKGFERTTLREIGEQAGGDAARVARYFGSKADLYIAVVAAERVGSGDAALSDSEAPYGDVRHIVEEILRRSDEHGPGPILQALVRLDTTDEIREAAESRLTRRLVEPLASAVDRDGGSQPRLRAEVAVAALLGVSLGRSLGWFDQVAIAERDDVVALVVKGLEAMLGGITGPLDPPASS
jgi:AcrR family transcriptional regulator